MTYQSLASAIAKREGRKSQARIGDIREILKIIVDLSVEGAADKALGLNQLGIPLEFLSEELSKKVKKLLNKKAKRGKS